MGTQRADLLIEHAAELITCAAGPAGARGSALDELEVIRDGALAIGDGLIADVGPTGEVRSRWEADEAIDATGRLVSPGFVDPHTHLVHGGSRHAEWEQRVLGLPSSGIAGGIGETVRSTRATGEEALAERALRDLDEALAHGTTTLEAKSGYGLDRETEIRLLRVVAGLEHPVDVVSTFLGAHVLPADHAADREAYVELVLELLAPARELAEFCDITCDPVGFTAAECRRIGLAAREQGLGIRVHADQTGHGGGTGLAVELDAASADHLEHADPGDIARLAASRTVGVLLPGVTYHLLEITPEAPALARSLVDSGVCLALATDYNPGSSPTLSMQAIMQLAARLYRLSYAAIWHMSTINAAIALDRGHDRGSIEPGKLADVLVWDVPEHGMVVNRFGGNLLATVIRRGEVVVRGGGDSARRRIAHAHVHP